MCVLTYSDDSLIASPLRVDDTRTEILFLGSAGHKETGKYEIRNYERFNLAASERLLKSMDEGGTCGGCNSAE
jgi:hypothetical protein